MVATMKDPIKAIEVLIINSRIHLYITYSIIYGKGPEYRSLLGLPDGVNSKYFQVIKEAADKKGITLKEGSGNDPDTLGKKMAFVMDSNKFPFNQAEVYHQFHDGFMPGEQYPQSYNAITNKLLVSGQLKYTGCPE